MLRLIRDIRQLERNKRQLPEDNASLRSVGSFRSTRMRASSARSDQLEYHFENGFIQGAGHRFVILIPELPQTGTRFVPGQ